MRWLSWIRRGAPRMELLWTGKQEIFGLIERPNFMKMLSEVANFKVQFSDNQMKQPKSTISYVIVLLK